METSGFHRNEGLLSLDGGPSYLWSPLNPWRKPHFHQVRHTFTMTAFFPPCLEICIGSRTFYCPCGVLSPLGKLIYPPNFSIFSQMEFKKIYIRNRRICKYIFYFTPIIAKIRKTRKARFHHGSFVSIMCQSALKYILFVLSPVGNVSKIVYYSKFFNSKAFFFPQKGFANLQIYNTGRMAKLTSFLHCLKINYFPKLLNFVLF